MRISMLLLALLPAAAAAVEVAPPELSGPDRKADGPTVRLGPGGVEIEWLAAPPRTRSKSEKPGFTRLPPDAPLEGPLGVWATYQRALQADRGAQEPLRLNVVADRTLSYARVAQIVSTAKAAGYEYVHHVFSDDTALALPLAWQPAHDPRTTYAEMMDAALATRPGPTRPAPRVVAAPPPPPEDPDRRVIGALDAAVVDGALAAQRMHLQGCHERARRADPRSPASVAARFTIRPNGKVVDLMLDTAQKPLAPCLGHQLRALRFPPASGATKVAWRLDLAAQSGP